MISRSDTSRMDAVVPPVAWVAGGALVQLLFPARRPPRWVRPLSLLVAVASASLGVWAVHGFRDGATTIHPHHIHDASSLVTTGANSVSRNPMYVALLGSLVAVALWRGRPASLLPVLGVWAALDRFQVRPEEAALSEAFGKDFDRYRRGVRRWL